MTQYQIPLGPEPGDATTKLQSIIARMWWAGYSYEEMAFILNRSSDRLKNQISKWKLSKPNLFKPRTGQVTMLSLHYLTIPKTAADALKRDALYVGMNRWNPGDFYPLDEHVDDAIRGKPIRD